MFLSFVKLSQTVCISDKREGRNRLHSPIQSSYIGCYQHFSFYLLFQGLQRKSGFPVQETRLKVRQPWFLGFQHFDLQPHHRPRVAPLLGRHLQVLRSVDHFNRVRYDFDWAKHTWHGSQVSNNALHLLHLEIRKPAQSWLLEIETPKFGLDPTWQFGTNSNLTQYDPDSMCLSVP